MTNKASGNPVAPGSGWREISQSTSVKATSAVRKPSAPSFSSWSRRRFGFLTRSVLTVENHLGGGRRKTNFTKRSQKWTHLHGGGFKGPALVWDLLPLKSRK